MLREIDERSVGMTAARLFVALAVVGTMVLGATGVAVAGGPDLGAEDDDDDDNDGYGYSFDNFDTDGVLGDLTEPTADGGFVLAP